MFIMDTGIKLLGNRDGSTKTMQIRVYRNDQVRRSSYLFPFYYLGQLSRNDYNNILCQFYVVVYGFYSWSG